MKLFSFSHFSPSVYFIVKNKPPAPLLQQFYEASCLRYFYPFIPPFPKFRPKYKFLRGFRKYLVPQIPNPEINIKIINRQWKPDYNYKQCELVKIIIYTVSYQSPLVPSVYHILTPSTSSSILGLSLSISLYLWITLIILSSIHSKPFKLSQKLFSAFGKSPNRLSL